MLLTLGGKHQALGYVVQLLNLNVKHNSMKTKQNKSLALKDRPANHGLLPTLTLTHPSKNAVGAPYK